MMKGVRSKKGAWLTHGTFFIILFMAMKYMGAKMIAYILNVTKFGYKSLKSQKLCPPYLS